MFAAHLDTASGDGHACGAFLGTSANEGRCRPRAHLVPQQPNHRMSRIQIGAVLVTTTRPRKENMSTSIPLICVENEKSKMVDTAKRGDGQQRLNMALKRPLASQRSIDSSARDWRGFFREQIFRYKLCTLTSTLCRKCKERYNLTRYRRDRVANICTNCITDRNLRDYRVDDLPSLRLYEPEVERFDRRSIHW